MSMLPEFDENGYLPRGIHPCTLEEVVSRFGQGSPEREVETNELVQFVQWARQAKVKRLVVDGSYVTAKISPNDADIVVLPEDEDPPQTESIRTMAEQWPFLHVIVAVDEADFEQWARIDFGLDRKIRARGVVEILL
jgi:hypothetical protein